MTTARARDAIAEDAALLIETLEIECRLLAELRIVLMQQRAGVAADNMTMVEDSVSAAHRVMGTLREAQRRRRALVELLTGTQTTSLAELGDALTPELAAGLADVRGRIGRDARALAAEIRVNRRILYGAVHMRTRAPAVAGNAAKHPGHEAAGVTECSS